MLTLFRGLLSNPRAQPDRAQSVFMSLPSTPRINPRQDIRRDLRQTTPNASRSSPLCPPPHPLARVSNLLAITTTYSSSNHRAPNNHVSIFLRANRASTFLHDHHDSPSSGHLRYAKTLNLIGRSYYWPAMARDVRDYVRSCVSCQRNKSDVTTQSRPTPAPSNSSGTMAHRRYGLRWTFSTIWRRAIGTKYLS